MDAESSFDHDSDELLHRALILAKVLVEEGTKDGKERLLLWELNCAKEEVTLETWVHNEGTGSGIHSSHVHCALDFFDCQLLAIVPMFIILMLTDERNGALGVVLVKSRHV